jgi:hypothetical protein
LVLTNVSGQWQGTVTENPNGSVPTYFTVVAMNLIQSGNNVQGNEFVEVTGEPQYFADFALSGTLNQSTNTLNFNQGTITEENHPSQWEWVATSYETQISASGDSMGSRSHPDRQL